MAARRAKGNKIAIDKADDKINIRASLRQFITGETNERPSLFESVSFPNGEEVAIKASNGANDLSDAEIVAINNEILNPHGFAFVDGDIVSLDSPLSDTRFIEAAAQSQVLNEIRDDTSALTLENASLRLERSNLSIEEQLAIGSANIAARHLALLDFNKEQAAIDEENRLIAIANQEALTDAVLDANSRAALAAAGALAAGPLLLGCVAACPAAGSAFAGSSLITQGAIVGGGINGGFNLEGQISGIRDTGGNIFDLSEYNFYTFGRDTAIGAATGALAGANILAGTGFVVATAEASVLTGTLGASFNFVEQAAAVDLEAGERVNLGETALVFGQNAGGTILSAGIGRGVTRPFLSDSARQTIGGFTLRSLIGRTGREATISIGNGIMTLHNSNNSEPPLPPENVEDMNTDASNE